MEQLENKMVLDEYWPEDDYEVNDDEEYLEYLDRKYTEDNNY